MLISPKFRIFLDTAFGSQSVQLWVYAFMSFYRFPSVRQDFVDGGAVPTFSCSAYAFLPRRFSTQSSFSFSYRDTLSFGYVFTH